MDAGLELREARQRALLTATALARLGNTSIPAISQIEKGVRGITVSRMDSLLRKTQNRLVVIPTVTSTPEEIARTLARLIGTSEFLVAYRVLLSYSDALKGETGSIRVALTLNSPKSTGSKLYDAALAAVVHYWLDRDGLPLPQWLNESRFTLEVQEALVESEYSLIPAPESVAHAFLVHNVLLDERALGGR